MAPASLNTGLLPLLLPLLHFTRAAVVVPRQQVTCDFEITASSGDTCQSFSDDWVLSLEDFESINPGVTCPNLVVGQSYCVLGTVSPGTTTMSSSTLTSSTLVSTSTSSPLVTSNLSSTSSTSSSSAPNQPQQTGTVANCDRFYLVKTGDSCDEIESQFDITASELLAWNPSINLGTPEAFSESVNERRLNPVTDQRSQIVPTFRPASTTASTFPAPPSLLPPPRCRRRHPPPPMASPRLRPIRLELRPIATSSIWLWSAMHVVQSLPMKVLV